MVSGYYDRTQNTRAFFSMALRIDKMLEGLEDTPGAYYYEVVGKVPGVMPYVSLVLLGPEGSAYEGEVIEWELCFKVEQTCARAP